MLQAASKNSACALPAQSHCACGGAFVESIPVAHGHLQSAGPATFLHAAHAQCPCHRLSTTRTWLPSGAACCWLTWTVTLVQSWLCLSALPMYCMLSIPCCKARARCPRPWQSLWLVVLRVVSCEVKHDLDGCVFCAESTATVTGSTEGPVKVEYAQVQSETPDLPWLLAPDGCMTSLLLEHQGVHALLCTV